MAWLSALRVSVQNNLPALASSSSSSSSSASDDTIPLFGDKSSGIYLFDTELSIVFHPSMSSSSSSSASVATVGFSCGLKLVEDDTSVRQFKALYDRVYPSSGDGSSPMIALLARVRIGSANHPLALLWDIGRNRIYPFEPLGSKVFLLLFSFLRRESHRECI